MYISVFKKTLYLIRMRIAILLLFKFIDPNMIEEILRVHLDLVSSYCFGIRNAKSVLQSKLPSANDTIVYSE